MKDKEWEDRGEARGRNREHDQEWVLTGLVGQRPISPAELPGGPSGWICWSSLRNPWRARPGGAPGPRSSRSPCLGTRYFPLKFDPPLLLPPVPQRQEPWVGNNIIISLWGISYEVLTVQRGMGKLAQKLILKKYLKKKNSIEGMLQTDDHSLSFVIVWQ